jgi:hypothetical protein
MLNTNKNCDCGCGGKTDCAYIANPNCKQCGEPLKNHECDNKICFTCNELENNRRLRLHKDQ